MSTPLRLLGILAVFFLTSIAWIALGGITRVRTDDQGLALSGRVADLWGSAQVQPAPSLTVEWTEAVAREEEYTDAAGATSRRTVRATEWRSAPVDLDQSRIQVGLHLDQRRKGLLWFPLYDVAFAGEWAYVHEGPARILVIGFQFPSGEGVYDDFHVVVDGEELTEGLVVGDGGLALRRPVEPGQEVRFAIRYRSRGAETWQYAPTTAPGPVRDFQLRMTTDFADIDYPARTMSPSSRTPTAGGWILDWTFTQIVTGYGIGMVMPQPVQPGELASELSWSAPISLGLFFVWIYVLGFLRREEIHPVNYLFIAAAFFTFNLLFAYTADHLPVEAAFALASVVSVGLVASYLRLVVGGRFALLESGVAQALYQVGFGVAHFFEGFTGLVVTVLGVVTLFALMQLTGRVRWGRAEARAPATLPG